MMKLFQLHGNKLLPPTTLIYISYTYDVPKFRVIYMKQAVFYADVVMVSQKRKERSQHVVEI